MEEYVAVHKPVFVRVVATVLLLLAIAGNLLTVDLFFSVDFVFGGIFAMAALLVLGPRLGIAIAMVSAVVTWYVWQHPYAVFIYSAEAVFVAVLLRRRMARLFLLSAAYWVTIGSVLVFLFYHIVMGIDLQGTLLIAMKQAVNGVFNAFCAIVLVLGFQLLIQRRRKVFTARHNLTSMLQLLIVGFVLIPLMVEIVSSGRNEFQLIQRQIDSRVQSQRWTAQAIAEINKLSAERELERFARELTANPQLLGDVTELQERMQRFLALYRRFYRIELYRNEQVVAGAQQQAHSQDQGVTMVTLLDSVDDEAVFLSAELHAAAVLPDYVPDDTVGGVILFTPQGDQLAASGSKLPPELVQQAYESSFASPVFSLTVPMAANAPVMELWRNTYFAAGSSIAHDGREFARLITFVAAEPFQHSLYAGYIRLFSITGALLLLSIVVSTLISQRFFRALQGIIGAANNLPDKIANNDTVQWPDSVILEFEELASSFHQAGNKIGRMFQQLKMVNQELDVARREAEALSTAKSEFIAGMSHELRTPLNAIIGYSNLLRQESVSEHELGESLAVIYNNGQHLLEMINTILRYASHGSHDISAEVKQISLERLLRDVTMMFRLRAREKGIELIAHTAPEVRGTFFLPERILLQVLTNLTANAIRYTDSGQVEIAVELIGHHLRFSVTDTGKGIPPEELAKIFTPFYQVGKIGTKQEGLGLGLSICKQLLERLHSRIEVETQLSQGSRFWFDISVDSSGEQHVSGEQCVDVPGQTVLGALRREAERGDVQALQRIISTELADYPDFSAEITQLMEDFALQEILHYLDKLT